MKTKHKIGGYIFFGILLVVLSASSFFIPGIKEFSSPTILRDFLLSMGNLGMVSFFLILLLSTVTPLPNTPIAIGGGYVYGTMIGTIIAVTTTIIGGSLYFFLIKKYGMDLLTKLVDKRHIIHFNHLFKKRGKIVALISFAIPIFPSTSVSLILGLTSIKFRTFFWIILLGHIPRYLIINSLGNDLYSGFTSQTIVILIITIALGIIGIFRENIKRLMFKEIKVIEKDMVKIEKKMFK